MVQIGLFRNLEGIQRIRTRLAEEEILLVDETVEIRGVPYQRLRVGPMEQPGAARTMSERLNRLFSVETVIIPVTAPWSALAN